MADIEALELEITSNSNGATDALDRLTAALERLDKITGKATGLSKMNTKMVKLNNTLSNITKSVVSVYAIKKVADLLGGFIKKSNDYVENMNLFTVSMGRFAEEAADYANVVSDVMGIDPSTWVRNQGVFMTLASGFGVAEDRAYTMSKNLTQLGYDLSSFFNIDYADAMTKLQSGLSGELEPLRRLGYDLSKAKLEAVALELGITKAFNAMSQAEKAQLRYYAIMTQVTQAQGDMARTLEQPANQVRVLQAQFEQCARAIGNIFIPALNAILPYAIAVTKVVRELAEYLAGLAGFTLPEVQWDGGFSGIADSATEAEEATKKLKKSLLGFDELNVLTKNEDTGAGTGGDEFSFELPEYDFLGDAVNTRVDEILASMQPYIDEITSKIGSIFSTVQEHLPGIVTGVTEFIAWVTQNLDVILASAIAVGVAFLAWKLADGLDLLGLAGGLIQILTNAQKIIGLFGTLAGAALSVGGAFDAIKNGLDLSNLMAMTSGLTLLVIGLGASFGVTGAAVGALVGGIALLTAGFVDWIKTGELSTETFIALEIGIFAVGAALAVLISPWALVVAGVAAAALAIYNFWDEISAFFTETIPNWWDEKVAKPFTEGFQAVLDFIVFECIYPASDAIESGLNSVKTFFTETIPNAAKNAGNAIKTFFTETIPNAASKAWEGIVNVWNNVVGWFDKNIIQPVGKFFTDLGDKISTTFDAAWNSVKLVWEKVAGWFDTNLIQPVGKFFTDLGTSISNAFSDAWNAVKTAWNKVTNWFEENIIDPIKNKFDTLVQDIGGFFEDFSWLDIGSNIVDGIKNGISGAWSTLTTWVTTAFDDLVGGVKDLLGINSPSKVFMEIGGYTMEGLEIGISKQAVSAANTMRDSMNRVVSSASAQSGRIASRTAVTIERNESGSSYDDSTAMAEQNALLREQNRIIEQLLRKETVAVVSPSAGLGRVISQSQKMYTAMAGG